MNIEKIIKGTFSVGLIIAGVAVLSVQCYGEEDSDELTEKKRCVSHQMRLCVGPDDKCPSITKTSCGWVS